MKPDSFRWLARNLWFIATAVALTAATPAAKADQIQMQNGDRYHGKVLSVNGESILLQSENLGPIRIPRAKVAWMAFGNSVPTNFPSPLGGSNVTTTAAPLATNLARTKAAPLRFGVSSNLVHQIESQYLSDASPEAKDTFNQLLGGLMSGQLDVQDIRAKAQSTANQVRAMRKDLGDEAGFMLDTYLAILDHFVKETAPAGGSPTNSLLVPKVPQSGGGAEAD